VVTDSTACLPSDLAARYGIRVVPLRVVAGRVAVDDGPAALSGPIEEELRHGARLSTASPAPERFAAAYACHFERHEKFAVAHAALAREDGAGAAFRVAPAAALVAALIAIGFALTTGGRHGAVLVAVAAGVTVILGAWYRRWLGGGTGDTLGAAAELAETAVLVAAAALV